MYIMNDDDYEGMIGNHEERVVANTETDSYTLDTCLVTDRDWTYETAVQHKQFRNNQWIVLEGCDTLDEAKEMHQKWLDFLDKDDYNSLHDCYESRNFKRQ